MIDLIIPYYNVSPNLFDRFFESIVSLKVGLYFLISNSFLIKDG